MTAGWEWTNRLNNHFAACESRVAAEVGAQADTTEPLAPRPRRLVSGAFRVHPATQPELSATVRQMSSSKACADDGITIAMIRMTFPVVASHLLQIVDRVGHLTERVVAKVLPLHKAGSNVDPNNYRPISILPTVAKVTERVICDI